VNNVKLYHNLKYGRWVTLHNFGASLFQCYLLHASGIICTLFLDSMCSAFDAAFAQLLWPLVVVAYRSREAPFRERLGSLDCNDYEMKNFVQLGEQNWQSVPSTRLK